MKLPSTICDLRFPIWKRSAAVAAIPRQSSRVAPHLLGFTMVEIAISLAIIGIALVAIIGVLPMGMRSQRGNREGTIINQDATVFIEAIRNGARGLDDLTNYVYAITNYWGSFNNSGTLTSSGVNGYTFGSVFIAPGYYYSSGYPINNGANIVGLMSTPEYTDAAGNPTNNLFVGGYSNRVVAYVRSMSGLAVEKPPQDNALLRDSSFGYRVVCANQSVAVDTNLFNLPASDPRRVYGDQLTANLHELRLTFLWPQLPNGSLGLGRLTYRTMIAGQLNQTNNGGSALYFFQSQVFTNAP
jgi:type II secretory pathway pseudopilin PulG